MKRLLSVCLLMLCLSIPILAGHTVAGGWCDCGAPGCICDPGENGGGNRASVPNLTRKQILAWADAHHRRTGEWPTRLSGPIPESPEDTWAAIDAASPVASAPAWLVGPRSPKER